MISPAESLLLLRATWPKSSFLYFYKFISSASAPFILIKNLSFCTKGLSDDSNIHEHVLSTKFSTTSSQNNQESVFTLLISSLSHLPALVIAWQMCECNRHQTHCYNKGIMANFEQLESTGETFRYWPTGHSSYPLLAIISLPNYHLWHCWWYRCTLLGDKPLAPCGIRVFFFTILFPYPCTAVSNEIKQAVLLVWCTDQTGGVGCR